MADNRSTFKYVLNYKDGYPSVRKSGDITRHTVTDFDDEVRIVFDELMSLLLKKHKDYGPKNIADAPGGALNGLRVRIHDKIARINNLIDNSKTPEYESLEDSFKDLANYSIIALLVLRGKWDK
jgi:hypothetical protein